MPGSIRRTAAKGEFEVVKSDNMQDALRGLLTSYPATHYARTEVIRFRSRVSQTENTRVSFLGEGDGVEFVHTRHPLLLLARHLERGPLSDTPWCSATVPSDMVTKLTALVWAVGSLEGYTSRAELLCVTVDCETAVVGPVSVDRAQEVMRAMSAPRDRQFNVSVDIEVIKAQAEQTLLAQFKGVANAFSLRDGLLTDKAKRAVHSHAERQITRNERQLSKNDLNIRLRNMYRGWNRRIEGETQSKLAEIERKSGVRSSLEIIGMAIICPEAIGLDASQDVRSASHPEKRSLEEIIEENFKDVPQEEWDRLPRDLTDRLDYYLYGTER